MEPAATIAAAFHCLWMTETWLGPEWKPDRAQMVLTLDPVTPLHERPGRSRPAAGLAQGALPRQLRRWAAASLPLERYVLVHVNGSTTVVLPDRDVALGRFDKNDRLVMRERMTPAGLPPTWRRSRALD